LTGQLDLDKHNRRPPNALEIQQRHIIGDIALCFQPLHAPVTGRGRQVHQFGQFGIGDPPCFFAAPARCGDLSRLAALQRKFFWSIGNMRNFLRQKSLSKRNCQGNASNCRDIIFSAIKEKIMLIGCPKEIKPQEFRVGLTPNAAHEAIAHGHQVLIETGAGLGAGFDR
jgi:hypothetical protein